MAFKESCCEASRRQLKSYYANQAGGFIPVFAGARRQQGHGFGALWNFFRNTVVPFLTPMAKEVGSRALTGVTRVAGDMLSGDKGIKESLKERFGQALRGEGKGYKRKRPKRKGASQRGNRKRARLVRDFFE